MPELYHPSEPNSTRGSIYVVPSFSTRDATLRQLHVRCNYTSVYVVDMFMTSLFFFAAVTVVVCRVGLPPFYRFFFFAPGIRLDTLPGIRKTLRRGSRQGGSLANDGGAGVGRNRQEIVPRGLAGEASPRRKVRPTLARLAPRRASARSRCCSGYLGVEYLAPCVV